MKRLLFLLSLFTASLFSTSLFAQGYIGVKGSSVTTENSAYKSSLNVGLFFGADLNSIGSNNVALEVDLSAKLSDGTVYGTKWSTQTSAIFAALRTAGDTYLKAKLGIHDTKTTVGSGKGSLTGIAYGLGFGFGNYELEYTVLKAEKSNELDINLFSVGYRF